MLPSRCFHFAVVTALTVWVCTNASDDEDQAKKYPTGIKCTKFNDIKSVLVLNSTEKTVIKVVLEDRVTTVIPTLPPTPATRTKPPEVEESRTEKSSTQTSGEKDFPNEGYGAEDYEYGWDYELSVAPTEVMEVLEEERERHEASEHNFPFVLNPRATEHSWAEFCREAAIEDETPIRVTDGGFHPKFEVVPGVGVYRFHATPMKWHDAREVCENEGAQLAVVNSEEEANALKSIHNRCPRLLDTHFNDYQFLGVHDMFGEGKWETYAGDRLEETGYKKWGFGQPDNAHHYGEDCLTMNRNGYFNDIPCWYHLPFTCEHA